MNYFISPAHDDLIPVFLTGIRVSYFVSRSNGKGRKRRRRYREILMVSTDTTTVMIGCKLTRKIEFLMQDVFPEELAKTYFPESHWFDAFLHVLQTIVDRKYGGV